MQSSYPAFAACQPGLEPILAAELTALGLLPRVVGGGVAFTAAVPDLMRCALWLGSASHVMLRLAEFPCHALGELQRKAATLPWRLWLRADIPVHVRASTSASRIYHTGAIEERLLQALATAFGHPPREPQAGEPVRAELAVRFHRDVCTLSLDTTTTPLHRRGYRLEGAKAPLREDIAHALARAGGLPGELPADAGVLDPFCGSGTLAIEAAGLRLGLAPGRLRPPPLQHTALFDAADWAAAQRLPAPWPVAAACGPIHAGDRDAGAVEAARHNAERAGVAQAIVFQNVAFTAQAWLAEPATAPPRGLLLTNPPFGHRIRGGDLRPLFQTLGQRSARLGPDWRVAMLAADVRLARRTGLVLRAAFTTRHGGKVVTGLCGSTALAANAPADGPVGDGE